MHYFCKISRTTSPIEAKKGWFDGRGDVRSNAQGDEVGIAKSDALEATRLKVRRTIDFALVSACEVPDARL